jgi:hypothetical protein
MPENIGDIINQARAPSREMGDLSSKAQRLGKALEIAEKWIDAAGGDTEMWNRAVIARDQLQEELSRTVFQMEVVSNQRLIAHTTAEAATVMSKVTPKAIHQTLKPRRWRPRDFHPSLE